MDGNHETSAYRALRKSAYRRKYEKALLFGGKRFTFSALLARTEYAYNTFRQMGVEPGERVCLCLPNCPDLLASFYGLSRLGAVGVLAHPASSARELKMQMEASGARRLITTARQYEEYCKRERPLPPGRLIICRPESDMRGKVKRAYLALQTPAEEEIKGYILDELIAENRYSASETPSGGGEQPAVILFGTSCFINARPILYSAQELQHTVEEFWRHQELVSTVLIENSFATEGGFLAAHSALCTGRAIYWNVGDPIALAIKAKPDFLVGTEEFFWNFRQQPGLAHLKWNHLQGGFQIGKDLTPLMEKFAGRAFAAAGGRGILSSAPVPLKVRREPLFFVRDFGVRLSDMEREIALIEGIGKCRCIAEGGGIRLKVLPDGKDAVKTLGRGIVSCCRREMNALHLPRSVEFCTSL